MLQKSYYKSHIVRYGYFKIIFCTFFDPEECDLRTTRPELQYNKWWRFFYKISYLFSTDLFHRFGSAGTGLVSRAARAGQLSEAVPGWWEGGPWTSAGGKVHLLCIIQARLERNEHGIWICLPLSRPANSIVWRMGGRRTCFRLTRTTCRALPRSRSGGAQICNLWWQAGFEWKKIILGCFFSLKEWQLTAKNQVSQGSHHALKQALLKTLEREKRTSDPNYWSRNISAI